MTFSTLTPTHWATLILALILIFILSACISVPADIKTKGDPLDNVAKLTFNKGGDQIPMAFKNQKYWAEKNSNDKQFASLASILGTAIVTRGVDLLGEKLKAAGAEKIRSIEAQQNFHKNEEIGVLTFERGDIELKAAMLPALSEDGKTLDREFVDFRLISLNYGETVDQKKKGVRGLAVTFEIKHPSKENPVTRSISVGNVKVGASFNVSAEESPFTAEYVQNPFARLPSPGDDDQSKASNEFILNTPFTLRVRLTETRNANALAKFAGQVADDVNDDATSELLKLLNLKKAEEQTASPTTEQKEEEGLPDNSTVEDKT